MNHDAQLQQQDEEERQKDTKSEKDDQIDLKAAREWDDWKDGKFFSSLARFSVL